MKFKRFVAFLATSVILSGVLCFTTQNNKETSVIETHAASHPGNYDSYFYSGSYYDSITDRGEGLNGLLRTALTNYIHPSSVPSYSGSGTTHLSTVLQYADEDPTDSSNMVYLYTRDSVKKNAASSWNREHVWPQSLSNNCWGTGQAGADLLHIRPTYNTTNSTRSNAKYKELTTSESTECVYNNISYGRKVNATYFMPLPASKGDVARIIMYVWVAYKNTYGNLPDITNVFNSYDDMMNWHISDRPDVLEGNRNDYAEKQSMQKNRNPFVDHPEWAWKIFGQNCSSSVLAAAKAAYPEDGTIPSGSISISSTTASIEVGDTTTLTATSSDGSTVSWYTSNENVASISASSAASGSGITVTGISEGTATITARITIDGTNYSATCQVTVTKSGGSVDPTPSTDGTYTIIASDLPDAYDQDGQHTSASGLAFVTNNVANYNAFQFKKNGSYLYSNTALNLKTITIEGDTNNKLTVYAGNTANPSTKITGTNGVYNVQSYSYFKIANDTSSAVKITGITVVSDGGSAQVDPSISLNKTSITIEEGLSSQITATAINGSGDVTWEVEDSEIAYIDVTSGTKCVVTGYKAGTTTVTATYSGVSATCTVTVTEPPVAVDSISISNQKVNYVEGDAFVTPTVTAHLSDGSTEDVTSSATFAGYDKTTIGSQTITVTYSGQTATYTVNVAHGTLSSITVSGQKTTYVINDTFSFTGKAYAVMENGYQKEIETPVVSSPDMSTTGTKTVIVSYTYYGVNKSTTYTINVNKEKSSLQKAYEACATLSSGATSNTASTFTGTITAFYGNNFYVQDGDYALLVYYGQTSSIDRSNVGKKVTITAKLKNYGGLYETATPTKCVIEGDGDTITPFDVTSYNSIQNLNQNIISNLSSAVVKSKDSSTSDMKLTITIGGQDIILIGNKNLTNISTLTTVCNTLSVGDYISVNNMVTSVHNSEVQLALTESSEITKGYSLQAFCLEFLNNMICDPQGIVNPSFVSGYSWNDLATLYTKLSSEDQNTLSTCDADKDGELANQFAARYDYLIDKYGIGAFANFANREITYNARNNDLALNSNMTLVVLIVSMMSVLTLSALLVIKAKKKNK